MLQLSCGLISRLFRRLPTNKLGQIVAVALGLNALVLMTLHGRLHTELSIVDHEDCTVAVSEVPVSIGGSFERENFDFSLHPAHIGRIKNGADVTSLNFSAVSVDVITGVHNTDWDFMHKIWACLSAQTFKAFTWTAVEDANDYAYSKNLRQFMKGKGTVLSCTPLPGQDHCGPARTRNTAIALTTAPYIIFLDPDDQLEPTYLEAAVIVLLANPEISLVNSYTVGFGAKKYLWQKTFFMSSLVSNQQNICVMLRREVLLRSVGTMDERWSVGEDWELWLEIINRGFYGFTIPEFLYWYWEKPWSDRFWRPYQNQHEVWAKKFPRLYRDGWPELTIEPRLNCSTAFSELSRPRRSSCKNLLLIVPWLAVGGADVVNVRMLEILVQDGWHATIAATLRTSVAEASTQDPDFMRPEFNRYSTDIFVLPHLMQVACYREFLIHLIRTRDIQLVLLSNSYSGYTFLPFMRAECPDVTFVDLIHMREENWAVSTPFHTKRKGGYSAMSAMYTKYIDATMAISDFEKSWLIKEIEALGSRSISQTKHTLRIAVDIPQGRDSNHFSKSGPLNILFVGRLVDQKRPMTLLSVFKQVSERIDAVLHVVGDGVLREKMNDYIRIEQLGSKVNMLGLQNISVIKKIYLQSDVLFMPSENEGMPIVLLEAMAHSLVPVVTDVGAISEVVDSEIGCLLGVADDQGMVDCLVRLGGNTTLLRSLANSARGRISQLHSMERMRRDLLRIVASSVAERHLRGNSALAKRALPPIEKAVQKILDEAGSSNFITSIESAGVKRKRHGFAKVLSDTCTESQEEMRSWITAVADLPICEYSKRRPSVEVMKDMLLKQCGQWCIFNVKDPDSFGFFLQNGECLVSFEKEHDCHKWTELKTNLRSGLI